MKQNNKSALIFIELYKAEPVLGDPTHPKYYNKHTKYDAWEESVKAAGVWNDLADCLFRNFENVLQAGVEIVRGQKPQCNCQSLFNWYSVCGILIRQIFIHSSMALQPFVGPWPLLQFRNLFYTDGRLLG
jgi:hypothetical protein